MSDLLTRKLKAVCDARRRGDQAAVDREWKEYRELQTALRKERGFGHLEDSPPMLRCGVSVDDSGIAHNVYRRV